ncbi:MAG: cell division protein FtsB [Betaproteobacteria bacterium]|jgi:cell division protein FtsB
MRVIVYGLLLLLIGIQYPLWLGKGGWLHLYQLDKEVKVQQIKNEELTLRNAKIAGDVDDLKQGTRAVEERARTEHGMVKDNEILVQVLTGNEKAPVTEKPSKSSADKKSDSSKDVPKAIDKLPKSNQDKPLKIDQ